MIDVPRVRALDKVENNCQGWPLEKIDLGPREYTYKALNCSQNFWNTASEAGNGCSPGHSRADQCMSHNYIKHDEPLVKGQTIGCDINRT